MKKLALIFAVLIYVSQAYSQIIWIETFNDRAQDDQLDNGPTAWSTSCPTCPPVIDGEPEDFHVDGPGGNRNFKWNGINTEGTWLSETVDISTWEDVSISIYAESKNPNTANDYIIFEYQLDGGPWLTFTNNGNLSGNFGSKHATVGPVNGNTIRTRVRAQSTTTARAIFIDNVTITGTDVLPVELISFDVSAMDNLISTEWEVASEKSVKSYIVQTSEDGFTFENSGEVKSIGDHSDKMIYSTEITEFSKFTKYVRLLEIGIDEREVILDTKSITLKSKSLIEIYGNQMKIDVNTGEYNLKIYSVSGLLIKELQVTDMNVLSLEELTAGQTGIFVALIEGQNKYESKKFVVQ